MTVHLGWEMQRNRVLTGFWTSPCLWLVLSEMRNCWGECPKCPNCISFTCHTICFSGHVQLLSIFLKSFVFPSHPLWSLMISCDNFAPGSSDAPILRERCLTTSLTTVHIIIRISYQCCHATFSLVYPITWFSFVGTFMNNLNSAVQTPQDSTAPSDVFMMGQKKLVLHVSPKCCCASSSFRWT